MNNDLNSDNDMDNQEINNDPPTIPAPAPRPTVSYEALPKPPSRTVNRPPARPNNYPDFSKVPSSSKLSKILLIIIVVIVVAFGAGWLGAYAQRNDDNISTAKEIVSGQSQVISAIVKDVNPSVVSIDAETTTQTSTVFGTTSTPSESEGTGIIISSSGYVVTNRHVIPAGTSTVTVTLADGTTINNVKVVGTTAATDPLDIAFLKISNSPETLQPALLGDSSKVQVGDSVVAIGNALGQFQNTITSGIISGRGRTIEAGDDDSTSSEDLQDLFQTDAAINPGNSGGPLINSNAEVIGINTALASDGAQNIGFSIPINDVEGLIKGVLATGTIERPYLGVYYETINPAIAKQYGLSITNGAFIPPNQSGQASIISGSPAATAGLQPEDVILDVNGVQVNADNSLSSLIDENQVGTKVNLTVLRSGSQKILQATIGNEPSS
jgi:serine protease Do